jgi:hypothetical protein
MTEIHKSVYFMVISIAFIDGALRIVNIPTFYLWKDYYHLSPGMNCLLRYITKIPWCVKPLFANLSDNNYIWGYRTKIYFIITGISQTVCLLLLGLNIPSVVISTIIIFLEQTSIAFRDTLAEGLMVVISQNEDRVAREQARGRKTESTSQSYVTAIFTLRFIGNLSSNYVAGMLLQYYTPNQVLAMCAVMPAFTIFQAIFFFKEKRVVQAVDYVRGKLTDFDFPAIGRFIDKLHIKGYLLFVLVLLLWPNTINGIRYFLIDDLGFTTADIGTIFTLSSLLYIVYMFFMNTFFSNYSFRGYYVFICMIMLFDIVVRIMMMLPDLVPLAFTMSLLDQSVNNLFYDLPSIPLLAIVCKYCPRSKEATFYAFFVSITNYFCSLANLTGFLFLDLMDVTETNYTNVIPVNILCGIWAVMLWNIAYHLKFPDERTQRELEPPGEPRRKSAVVSRKKDDEYSEPVSLGDQSN